VHYVGGLTWHFHYNTGPDWLGFIPLIILDTDKRPVREQIAERYAHGGGWSPFSKFKVQLGADSRAVLVYPGDPPMRMWCECDHPNGERLQLFDGAWFRIIQPDGSFEISRLD
jgi:hypothetical protein